MACKTKTPKKKHLKNSKYKLKNWPEYNAALKKRGSFIVWIDPDCESTWYYNEVRKPGGRIKYSDMAIQMYLQIKMVYHQPLRQTQGLLSDFMSLIGLNLDVPDYTVVSKRSKKLNLTIKRFTKSDKAKNSQQKPTYMIIDSTGLKVYGAGEWANVKHGTKFKRIWRKLHISVDENGDIQAVTLTDKDTDDASQVPKLKKQIPEKIDKAVADGAYDTRATYQIFLDSNPDCRIIIPPRSTASSNSDFHFKQRHDHIEFIANYGRDTWDDASQYYRQSRAENTMFRYKLIIGNKLSSRCLESQKYEAVLGCTTLNKMASFGMPNSYKVA